MPDEVAGFRAWCIVELMGHVTLAGFVTETEIGGGKLMQIDVPKSKGMQPFTSFFGSSSVYKLTPVDEETVRTYCERAQQQPFQSWELKSAFNDWAAEHREELKDELRQEVRRELAHDPTDPTDGDGFPL
jgi:hypothetical protein